MLTIATRTVRRGIRALARRNYYAAKALYHYEFRREVAMQHQLILVYQMGKVGSSSVVKSLDAAGCHAFNIHTLDPDLLRQDETALKPEFVRSRFRPKTLWQEQVFLSELKRDFRGKKLKVVTLVRDPIARNIALFFQRPNMIAEQTARGYSVRSPVFEYDMLLEPNELEEKLTMLFLTRFKRHERPLHWFDLELKCNFGFDVYAHPFPRSKGYAIYRHDSIDILVLKLEHFNTIAREAFNAFLGTTSFEPCAANVGRRKETSDLYSRFLAAIALPASYLDRMYDSQFAMHFYDKKELNGFRRRWAPALKEQ